MSRKTVEDIAFSCTCGTLQGHITARGVRTGTHVVCYAAFGLGRRVIASRLSGRWKRSDFFNADTGAPVVEATVLTKDERAAFYD